MNTLRFAVRSLVKSPGFTAVAVLTLAPGMACANVAGLLLVRASVRRREFAIEAVPAE